MDSVKPRNACQAGSRASKSSCRPPGAIFLVLLLCFLVGFLPAGRASYSVGVGIADTTGPVAEVVFMGYAKMDQKGTGLHLRTFSRAFVIDDGEERFVFVSVDSAMIGHGVRAAVLRKLQTRFEKIYTEKNVMISGTHTHSSPGGFMMDVLFDLTTFGFVQESFNALVNGITKSIERAHDAVLPARIFLTQGQVLDANINRSPLAYMNNPKAERDKYEHNVDKTITQLQFIGVGDRPLGAINWFAVHPTSMNNTNRLVSSDNVGYASVLFEKVMNKDAMIGKGPFVAAFASSNLGDVSPNTRGPKCEFSGKDCSAQYTCPGKHEMCFASGPGRNMFESTSIIARKLFQESMRLWQGGNVTEVLGPIRLVHRFVDMPKQTAEFLNETTGSKAEMVLPYEWQPKVVSTHVAVLGNVIIAGVPGEFTTMSGRRLRDVIRKAANDALQEADLAVIVAGLCNTYSDYITTPEEYQIQRYEGASTIYGPHTLTIYLKQYQELVTAAIMKKDLEPGPLPPDLLKENLISLVTPVLYDTPKWRHDFGDCLQQPPAKVFPGDVVTVQFVSGHPRNNLMTGSTYLTVERLNDDETWTSVATDADWETTFVWERTSVVLGSSDVLISWKVPDDVEPGHYRIRHNGHYRYILGGVYPYQGVTNQFQVLTSAVKR
ncbi:neutral ceramidase isoform X3 [Cephus cinctus]|uniref:Neutral ceramidase n=1 Tax=Cephus cinctus TaxID=211228 RepID=A0AAJ7RQ71_CEPCN|nr:neutral ceramidase isoform X3 [Cephus cinctus]